MNYGSRNGTSNKKVIGKLRKTQLITTFGTGSIVDMHDYSVIMAATNYWGDSPRLYEPNLQKLLGMAYFREPKATEMDFDIAAPDIPAFRFPMIHFCPKCYRLMTYKYFGTTEIKKCSECGRSLVPSRFVAACINGHLEDFPYKWWVHYGDTNDCTDPDSWDKLKIEFSSKSGGLGSIKIICTACEKERTMEGSMSKDALKGYHCRGSRPWIGNKSEHYDPEPCGAVMQTLQRGASNVYFSVTQSALTIPPWSKKIQNEISKYWEQLERFMAHKPSEDSFNNIVDSFFATLIEKGQYTMDDFKREINRRLPSEEGSSDTSFDKYRLFEEEFKALCAGTSDEESEDQFKAKIIDAPEILNEFLDCVALVKRLREVLALKGFRRITPDKPGPGDERAKGMRSEDFTMLGSTPQEWLPAIELLGEGIFLKFNEKKIAEWELKNGPRFNKMRDQLGDENIGDKKFSPRYVMLHTFSHLLIRQLSIDCGYSGAAIKERIYSTYTDSGTKMAGILLYTSSSDSDGSLGGLVRQGQPELLNNTIRNMLEEASWCSSDPLCIESVAQGYNSLNYAACHACTLLPETSCESRNCLLDRVAVIGKSDQRELGYLGKLLEV